MFNNYKDEALILQGIFFILALSSNFFVQNNYLVSFTVFMFLSIVGHILVKQDRVQKWFPDSPGHQMVLDFLKPLLWVGLNFLLFHSLEKHDLAISLAIITLGLIRWFFCYSQITKTTLSFSLAIYIFCSIVLTPVFYFLFFLIADLHFKVQVSFDDFNQILFLFMAISMIVRTFLNYNLLTRKIPESIHHLFYFLGLDPLILIIVNWLFYPLPYSDTTFLAQAIYCLIPYFLPIVSFIYLITSGYIKQIYFNRPKEINTQL
jgi:hypothetical protein